MVAPLLVGKTVMRLRFKIGQLISGASAALFAAGLLVMGGITGTSIWFQSHDQMQEELASSFAEVELTVKTLASETRAYAGILARHPDIVEALASDPKSITMPLRREFDSLRAADPEVEVLEVLNATGIVVHRAHNPSQAGDSKANQPVVVKAMSGGNAAALTYSTSSQQLAYVGVEAIRWQGRIIGYLTVGKRLSDKLIARLGKSAAADISVLLGGKFIRSTHAEVTQDSFGAEDAKASAIAPVRLNMKAGHASLFGYAAPVPRDDGSTVTFVLSRDRDLIARRFYGLLFWPVVAGLTALALLTPLLIMMGRRFSRLFDQLSDSMSRLASGAWNTAIPHLERTDEVGDMAKAVQVFRDNGLKVREQEAERAREAERSAERLAAIERFNADTSKVIAAAVRGQLSARIVEAGVPEGLEQMAQSLNRLLTSFDATISSAVEGMEKIADGDLTNRVAGAFEGEFGRMSSAANALAERFQGTIGDIVSVTQDVKSATDEILFGVNDLSQRTAQQAEISEQTMSKLSNFAATFRSASDMANGAASKVRDAEAHASSGEGHVVKTREAMERISAASRRISDITTIIADVAFQTNLLALNAAVEAARAGEAGRGFAVVATEVRALAERAAGASRDVKQLVDGAVGEIDMGVGAVEQTEVAFSRIADAIRSVSGLVINLSTATGSQAASVDELGGEIERLGEMAQQNAALVEESNAMLENANGRIADLSRLARQFRIGGAQAGEGKAGLRAA